MTLARQGCYVRTCVAAESRCLVSANHIQLLSRTNGGFNESYFDISSILRDAIVELEWKDV